MAIATLTQSEDWDFIPISTVTAVTRKCKAIRIDQSGSVIITPKGEAAYPAGNYVQGEVLQIQGFPTITTDGTARVQVFY